MDNSFDVIILGGGLAGLTCSLHLKKEIPNASILVIEKEEHPVREAAHKVGESTVEIAAYYLSDVLKVEDHIKESQLPKLGLRCFFKGRSPELDKRLELGSNQFFPRRSYQLDRGRFENFLGSVAKEKGISFISNARVRRVKLNQADAHEVLIDSNGGSTYRARWVIDASGRAALIKREESIAADTSHDINAVWFRVGTKLNIDTWSRDPYFSSHNFGAKSRWFSTNHLMGEGYWVWIIPLASGSTSIGIVSDPRFHDLSSMNSFEKALAWLKEYEPVCAQEVAPHTSLIQDFLALKKFSRKATQVSSSDRWVLTGDSGVFIDPLYSPGSDFIAFANTFVTDLIKRDLRGGKVQELTKLYNDLFLSFSENTFSVYQDQYQILGNPVVMPLKIIWDFATYWSFFAFFFTHDKLCDIGILLRVKEDLQWISRINREMQAFLREWSSSEKRDVNRSFIDLAEIPYLYNLNKALTQEMDDPTFLAVLTRNIQQLTSLALEIVHGAQSECPTLQTPSFLKETSLEPSSCLQDVFSLLGYQITSREYHSNEHLTAQGA